MFDHFQFALIRGPDIPGSYAILFFTALGLASITSHIHSWVFFLLWLHPFHANGKQKKTGVAILISDKIDLKIKRIIRDKEGHYIMIKGSIQEEDITVVNIYAPNIGPPQYIKQTLTEIKEEIDSNTIIVGDFNTPIHTSGQVTKTEN